MWFTSTELGGEDSYDDMLGLIESVCVVYLNEYSARIEGADCLSG